MVVTESVRFASVRPGVAIVSDALLALVDEREPTTGLVAELATIAGISDESGLGTVIDAVLTALVAMQPVSAAPSFAIVVWDGAQVELLVRGRVIVEVWTGDGGHERVTGVGTHTWRGQSFAGVVSLVARLDDDADRADYPLWFSARSGVIPASTISWHHGEIVARPYAGPAGSDPEPARDVDPQPEPVPQPDPEPDLQPEVAAA
ncbi:MAG: hypothetical protein KA129_04190, partial [Microthrixaceae bacterium]|nr:hypothetical protein [Microthrixaceae bacterium]